MDVDQAIGTVGGFRRWHCTLFFLLGISAFTTLAWHKLSIVFTGWIPPYHCKIPEGRNFSDTIPVNDDGTWQACTMFATPGDNSSIIPCTDGWQYHGDGAHTVVSEWDLVCDKDYLSDISQVLYGSGEVVGEISGAIIIDWIGRRRSHLLALLAVVGIATGLSFTQSYIAFIVMRFVLAATTGLLPASGATLILELFDASRRHIAANLLEYMWTFGYVLLCILAYFLRDWRVLQLVIGLGPLLVFFPYIWVLPESTFWLVVNNRHDEAEKTLQRFAKWNGVHVNGRILKEPDGNPEKSQLPTEEKTPEHICSKEKEQSSDELERTGKLADLFKDPILRKHAIIASFFWFANILTYYAIVLSVATLAGNRFLNFGIMGILEIPAFLGALIGTRKSRRLATCFFLCMAGIFLAAATIIIIISDKTGTDLSVVVTVMAMIAKFAITASFACIVLYSGEIFPTNLRGTSGGLCRLMAGLGNISAPFLAYGTRKMPWLPNLIEAVVVLAVGLMALALPETAGKPLPQTIKDVYELYDKPPKYKAPIYEPRKCKSCDQIISAEYLNLISKSEHQGTNN